MFEVKGQEGWLWRSEIGQSPEVQEVQEGVAGATGCSVFCMPSEKWMRKRSSTSLADTVPNLIQSNDSNQSDMKQ